MEARWSPPGQGDLVMVEGRVSAKNRILIHDYVDAAKENNDAAGRWAILEEYHQPILADLKRGEIILTPRPSRLHQPGREQCPQNR